MPFVPAVVLVVVKWPACFVAFREIVKSFAQDFELVSGPAAPCCKEVWTLLALKTRKGPFQ